MLRLFRLFFIALGVAGATLALPPMVRAVDIGMDWRSDLTPAERARVAATVAPASDFAAAEPFETLSGGAATSIEPPDRKAFSHLSGNLPTDQEMRFHLGRALFRKRWVPAPSSTQASDGLGPLFNARSCESCHQRDGRGHPPLPNGDATSFFLRLARPAATPEEKQAVAAHQALNFPDPVYGSQLQDRAIPGLAAEGAVAVTYGERREVLADGTTVSLRVPRYAIEHPAYGPLAPETNLSPRMTQPMIGLGLVEAIDPGDILAHQDPDDRNGDGISGRAAMVRDHRTGKPALGRFGWKAQNATVRDQTAAALAGDIGISSPDVDQPQGDCQPRQTACLKRPDGVQKRLGKTEAPDPVLDLLTFYAQNLAVPARRKASFADVLKGKQVFYGLGCPACHVPKYVSRRDAAFGPLSYQLIWPYSDFLLHDMGEGLADGQSVGDASGQEWRTPPLWGLGLTKTVNGNTFYLHDGRARTLDEAILWHGGEAAKARDAFKTLNAIDRQSLTTFLESL